MEEELDGDDDDDDGYKDDSTDHVDDAVVDWGDEDDHNGVL